MPTVLVWPGMTPRDALASEWGEPRYRVSCPDCDFERVVEGKRAVWGMIGGHKPDSLAEYRGKSATHHSTWEPLRVPDEAKA